MLPRPSPPATLPPAGERSARELRDLLRVLLPNLDFRDAALAYTGDPLTVIWPSDNGCGAVIRIFYPPFTPVDREEDNRVACNFFDGNDSDHGVGLAKVQTGVRQVPMRN